MDYASVKGFMIMRPYGYAIWENMTQQILDGMFKETGHENVAMPVLIPESLLQQGGGAWSEGFAPECAWVTMGGERQAGRSGCAVRPTCETLFCDHWAHVLQSYKQLPMLYNQWCSVVRWEKTTRPFLRSRWSSGGRRATPCMKPLRRPLPRPEQQLQLLRRLLPRTHLAMPVLKGRKTDKEKFAGAEATYTIEAMMKDGKALQSGTSHYFGDKFCRAYDVTYHRPGQSSCSIRFQTSWGACAPGSSARLS